MRALGRVLVALVVAALLAAVVLIGVVIVFTVSSTPLPMSDQCVARDIPFFFKQWGGVNRKKTGRVLEGKIWDEMPEYPLKRLRCA